MADSDPAAALLVVGENVVDLVPEGDGRLRPVLGGGPANIAVTVARLGAPVAMAARLGADAFGRAIRGRLVDAGVDARFLVSGGEPSTLALVSLTATGDASYDFWLTGAADFAWGADELPPPGGFAAVHVGSLAAFLPPGADTLRDLLTRAAGRAAVTLDPNLRRTALEAAGVWEQAVTRLEWLVAHADLVKVSVEDLAAAHPGVAPEEVVARWLTTGPGLVVLTRGAHGATAYTAGGLRVDVPAVPVEVVDTIGAGDAAMGALLTELYRRNLLGPDAAGRLAALAEPSLSAILTTMTTVAALTCARPGADPPTAGELAAALSPR